MGNQKLNELVAKWLNKPTFKLEDEPGYEAYREKLLIYRHELQKNVKIRALQEKILSEQKEQWVKFPARSLADDPELNLFKDELQTFCNEMYAKIERDNSIHLLNDIKRTFMEIKEQFAEKNMDEKVSLIRMYENIDLSIIKPNTPGLENFKNTINKWIETIKVGLRTE